MTPQQRKSPLFQELLHFAFETEHNRKAFYGDEIEIKHLRYRLVHNEWVLVTSSAESDDMFVIKDQLDKITIKKPMKQATITLEEARLYYRLILQEKDPISSSAQALSKILLSTFSEDELTTKEGYTWEESFDGGGCFINYNNSEIVVSSVTNKPPHYSNKCLFKTKEQAESALAYAQLTHIVHRANRDKTIDVLMWAIIPVGEDHKLEIRPMHKWQDLFGTHFYDSKDAEQSLITNRKLWEQYWCISSFEKNISNS